MAKLIAMPHQDIIDGLKGSIDFYIHDGVACARSWPRSPGKQRAPAVMAQWPNWTYSAREWVNLSPIVQAAYIEFSTNSGLTGRDMQMRGYLSGLYRYELP
ncbi:hypothetical protein ES705_26791 [subsurface metagenome]